MRLRIGVLVVVLAAGQAACRRGSDSVGSVALDPSVVRLGYPQSVAVKLRWRPVRALDRLHGSPVVFVHMLDRSGKTSTLLRTYDHALPAPWAAGQPQDDEIDVYQSALADPLPPGRYVLSLGLYDDSWGYRWPLDVGPEVARREYRAAEVEVSGPDPSAPKFSFSGGWKPVESVATRQVLAHRCLTGKATLSVDEIRSPGALRLQWTAPAGLALETTCETGLNGELGMLGPDRRWVSIRVPAGSGVSRCEVRFEPGTPKVPPSGPGAAELPCLEVLSWRPDAPPKAASGS